MGRDAARSPGMVSLSRTRRKYTLKWVCKYCVFWKVTQKGKVGQRPTRSWHGRRGCSVEMSWRDQAYDVPDLVAPSRNMVAVPAAQKSFFQSVLWIMFSTGFSESCTTRKPSTASYILLFCRCSTQHRCTDTNSGHLTPWLFCSL